MSFGNDFLRSVLWMMANDDSFAIGAKKWLEKDFFQTPAQKWIFENFCACVEGGRPPDWVVLREGSMKLPQDLGHMVRAEADSVKTCGVSDTDGIKELVRDYAKRAHFAVAFQKGRDLYQNGSEEDAYALMLERMEEVRSINFDSVDRQWLACEFEDRQQRRRLAAARSAEVIPTGIAPVDEVLDGGLRPSQLAMMMAYSKVGKSMWLRHVGAIALRMRKRVLHIVLEGSGDETAGMYDAWFSGEDLTNVKLGIFAPEALNTIRAAYSQLPELCVIRTLNDWDSTAVDIESEIRELSAGGWRPDLLIVDYADLLRARSGRGNMSETDIQVSAYKDLKRLCLKEGIACWTASQLQRPKAGWENKAHICRSSGIADAYGKVRTVDLACSLNRTEDEANDSTARIFIEHYRHGSAGVVVPVRTSYAHSKFIYDPALSVDKASKKVGGGSSSNFSNQVATKRWWDD